MMISRPLITSLLTAPALATPVLPVPQFGHITDDRVHEAATPPVIAVPALAQAALDAGRDEHVRSTILTGETTMPVVTRPVTTPPARGDISLNLPQADVSVVAATVLGDLLHKNFTIAPGLSGPVSFVTPYPVSRGALIGLLEDALRASNMALVPQGGGYAIQASASTRAPIAQDVAGFGSEVISLRFINADEVRKVLDSLLPGVVTSTDTGTGTITISGTTGQRGSARDLLRQFDVDWLRNTSFALYVPQKTDSRLIVPSLDKLINAPDSPTRGLVRLLAMDQINGILAISTNPQYLQDVRRWIEILDREGQSTEPRIYVYRVQNGRARDLTRTINAAFGSSGGGAGYGSGGGSGGSEGDNPASAANGFGQQPAPPPSVNGASGGGQSGSGQRQNSQGFGSNNSNGGGPGNSGTHVTSDEVNNAVIIYATPREYAVVEDALRKLDLPPTQVMIEAAITEVGLNDDLGYGVQWNFASNGNTLGVGTASAAPGGATTFSYSYTGSSIAASLKALEQRTSVKVVSAPKLLVLNNQTAALQVGDQVPISTGSATNLTGTTSIVNTIEYRDTGVILKITPRVNASGVIQLDVSQEVSDVSTASSSSQTQQQTPTISTRRIATTVAVPDNQVIALGGLFRDNNQLIRNGIPFLSRIPVLGGLFGTQQKVQKRTELVVLLKPHVLHTPDDGRAVTEELRAKLRTLEPFRSTGRIP
ncbi:type II secretion system secretin GspD [Novosphingobium sp. FKTRR1]|uniref:type II secretion system secretin GspD n=1 Tax=Novosphingobium sp. FKTRR1 TaxID=2879118 RepID=UPI001CEFCE09|nr:type II secretion system secretin GspD [Novosphingobium sp. FKTRR1]